MHYLRKESRPDRSVLTIEHVTYHSVLSETPRRLAMYILEVPIFWSSVPSED